MVMTLAFYNIKGGVGKTAACVNTAYLASRDGWKVLLWDLDPQGSATYYLRMKPGRLKARSVVRNAASIEESIRESDFEGLDVLPASLSLRRMDLLLDDAGGSRKTLGKALREVGSGYDLVLLDCPPNITLLAENIFRAADLILVPVIPTTLSILSLDRLRSFFRSEHLDASKLLPFFSMSQPRMKVQRDILEAHSEQGFLEARIPFSAMVEKMGIHRKPLHAYALRGSAPQAFERLWQEIRTRAGLVRGKEI